MVVHVVQNAQVFAGTVVKISSFGLETLHQRPSSVKTYHFTFSMLRYAKHGSSHSSCGCWLPVKLQARRFHSRVPAKERVQSAMLRKLGREEEKIK